ncbi:MAG: dTDP-4-amino-4,6-dideoxygalactose transaminase [Leptospiraceae bacterium]|nr:dTDP-4-amino-4,6-dideoxygalactose transaminase [Leptospiraceae bacterium]
MLIPFDKPTITGDELRFMADVHERGLHLGQGEYTRFCESWISERYGNKTAFLTFSGTTALEVIFSLLDLQPGDEVILPSYSFPSCANAVLRAGGVPVLADIESDTLGLDPESVRLCLSERTKVVLCIHYAGLPCKIDELDSLCATNNITLVEDCAQAFLSSTRGRMLGSFGTLAMLSFSTKKLIHCGQGGAILLNDDRYLARAEILRDRGTNRADFLAGRVPAYSWQAAGTSFSPSELNAAFLKAQLLHSAAVIGRARKIFQRYLHSLAALEKSGLCKIPPAGDAIEHNGSLFYLVARNQTERDQLIRFLAQSQIVAQFHFVPLHLSNGRRLTRTPLPLPVTEQIYAGLVRLPLYDSMSDNEVDAVIGKIFEFYRGIA